VLVASWEDILAGADAVLARCRTLDLEQAVAESRFMQHRTRLAELVERFRDGGAEGARELYDTDRLSHVVALTEIGELSSIGPFIQTCDPSVLRPKLRDALRGPVYPDEEDENSNHARNIMFELNLAAKLAEAGLFPALGDRPDLTCSIDGKTLLIECKRAMTPRGARKRIKLARNTLQELCKRATPGTRGVIALSVAKIFNPGDAIFSAATELELRSGLQVALEDVAARFNDAWAHIGTKVVGVLFYVITPAFVEDRKLLAIQQRTNGHGLANPATLDGQVFRRLMDSLKNVYY
jgi:hypothetical protein